MDKRKTILRLFTAATAYMLDTQDLAADDDGVRASMSELAKALKDFHEMIDGIHSAAEEQAFGDGLRLHRDAENG